MKTKIWYTADGRDVQLRQMSVEHIRNCLAVMRHKAQYGIGWRARYYEPLIAELRRRG